MQQVIDDTNNKDDEAPRFPPYYPCFIWNSAQHIEYIDGNTEYPGSKWTFLTDYSIFWQFREGLLFIVIFLCQFQACSGSNIYSHHQVGHRLSLLIIKEWQHFNTFYNSLLKIVLFFVPNSTKNNNFWYKTGHIVLNIKIPYVIRIISKPRFEKTTFKDFLPWKIAALTTKTHY